MQLRATTTPEDDKLTEALRQDTPQVLGYLQRLAAAVPGVVSPDLIGLLAGAAENEAALAVLAAAMRGQQQQGRR